MAKIYERNPDTGVIRSRDKGDYGNETVMAKLKLIKTEWYTNTSWRVLEINTEDYPEFKGLSEDEIIQLIDDKYHTGTLDSINGPEGYSLDDMLQDADIVKDKYTNEDEQLEIETITDKKE